MRPDARVQYIGKIIGDFEVLDFYSNTPEYRKAHPGDYKMTVKCVKCQTVQEKFSTSFYRELTSLRACVFCRQKFRFLQPVWKKIQGDTKWKTIEEFYADMGDRPKGLNLVRLDSRIPWSKENCIWGKTSQMVGKVLRKGKTQILVNGQIVHASQVAEICNISRERVRQLLNGIKPNRKGEYVESLERSPLSLEQILERYPGGQQWLANTRNEYEHRTVQPADK